MNYKLLSVALAFLYIGMVGGCSQPAPDLRYQIEVDKPLQTMEHFGASDAWSMHILGLYGTRGSQSDRFFVDAYRMFSASRRNLRLEQATGATQLSETGKRTGRH